MEGHTATKRKRFMYQNEMLSRIMVIWEMVYAAFTIYVKKKKRFRFMHALCMHRMSEKIPKSDNISYSWGDQK